MKPNEGSLDRAARVILGIVALVAAWMWLGLGAGAVLGIVVAIVGAVLILTGLIGFCPAYRLVGMSTCRARPGGAS